MADTSIESIWQDADSALFAEDRQYKTKSLAEDAWGNCVSVNEFTNIRSKIVRLPDGDIHICSSACPFAVSLNDGDRVCPHTGHVVGRCCEDRTDSSTGRSSYSADPDMVGPQLGGWRKKRCMVKASVCAFRDAKLMNDAEMPKAIEAPAAARAGLKRGALCVDEVAPTESTMKRTRNSKKSATHSTLALLVAEATGIFSKLTKGGAPPRPNPKPRLTWAEPKSFGLGGAPPDLLFSAAVRKYLRETVAVGMLPVLDDINNISLAVKHIVAQEKIKREGVATATASGGQISSVGFKSAAARLAVALWSASCKTAYLSTARRGADSFKSFCCGVFYAFKRGISLSDGTILVPQNLHVAAAMPAAKTINTDAALKSLHASSHRGLCTLHRCIASVPPASTHALFGEAVRASVALQDLGGFCYAKANQKDLGSAQVSRGLGVGRGRAPPAPPAPPGC